MCRLSSAELVEAFELMAGEVCEDFQLIALGVGRCIVHGRCTLVHLA